MMVANNNIPLVILPSTAFIMSGVAGFTDVISFVGVNHLFTAHITGNIVIAISEIINHDPGLIAKILAIPVFMIFAGGIAFVIEKKGKTPLSLLLWILLEILLMGAFMWGGLTILPYYPVNAWEYYGVGMLAVCSMAVHNTLLRTFMTTFPPCTVMTGNLTQFTVDFVTYVLNKQHIASHEKLSRAKAGLKRYGNVILGFTVGGIFAAFGYSWVNFWVVCLPILALFFLSFMIIAGQQK